MLASTENAVKNTYSKSINNEILYTMSKKFLARYARLIGASTLNSF